jgi:hypothetical protein
MLCQISLGVCEPLGKTNLPHSAVYGKSESNYMWARKHTLSTLTMISLSSWSLGIGLSSTETLPGPWKTTAFIVPVDIVFLSNATSIVPSHCEGCVPGSDMQEEFEDTRWIRSKPKWVRASLNTPCALRSGF